MKAIVLGMLALLAVQFAKYLMFNIVLIIGVWLYFKHKDRGSKFGF